MIFTSAATRLTLLRSWKADILQSVFNNHRRIFSSGLAASVASLKGVNFMAIDQLR